jgi:hypothetical protein
MNIVIGLFHDEEPRGEYYTEALVECDEYTERDSARSLVSHERNWEEYGLHSMYCATYTVEDQEAFAAEQFRLTMEVGEYDDPVQSWRELYHILYSQSKDHLVGVQDSLLRAAGDAGQLDRNAFARMIVAFVQDIPYQYVLPEGCDEAGEACNANVRWGVYSPVEFMYHLKGDCDTRTVLLFTLLKNFGYDPLIINSMQYRHSMLALDIPGAGDEFNHKGRRYSFWETTNVGWLPGMLPPEMNNKDYWTVALDYEY